MANYSFGPYTLYDYQQRIIEMLRSEIVRLRKAGKPPHIILQAPCGSGKGLLVTALASLTRDKGGTFLFAVSGRTLVSQVSHKFAECNIPHGILMALSHQGIEHDQGVHIDNKYIANNPDFMKNLPVVVASRDTYGSRVFSRKTMEKLNPDITCVDEMRMGHNGKVYRSLLNENKDKVIIGFDATPAKASGYGFGDLYQSLIHGTTYKELLKEGFLVPAVCFGPRNVDFTGVPIGINGEYVQDQAAARFDKNELIGDIIRDWKTLAQGRPTIVFAQSVQHSVHIAEMFNANGIVAEHLEAKTPLSVRKRVYDGLSDGTVQVATNYAVLKYGVDIPAAGCVILACKMASLPGYIQAVGRGFRACKSVFWNNGNAKENCILEGSLVLTDRGLVRIEKVMDTDKVWDGSDFVSHKGAVYKGEKEVISYAGLTATPDHRVWTSRGFRSLLECLRRNIPICETESNGRPILERNCHFRSDNQEGHERRQRIRVRGVPEMQEAIMGILSESECRENSGVPSMQSAETIPNMAVESSRRHENEVPKQKLQSLRRLRGTWNRIQIQIRNRRVSMDQGQYWNLQGPPGGQDRKRRTLRAGKPEMVNCQAKSVSHKKTPTLSDGPQIQAELSTCQIRGFNPAAYVLQRHDGKSDRGQIPESQIIKTKGRVWDILSAGPLHRFTVSGVLVHNCIIIDHSANIQEHGWPTEDRFWTLNPDCTVQEETEKQRTNEEKEPLMMSCSSCGAEWEPKSGTHCPNCGYQKPKIGKRPNFNGQKLARIRKSQVKTTKPNTKQKVWMTCLGIAGAKNLSYAQAVKIFETKTGSRFSECKVSPIAPREDAYSKVSSIWPGFARSFRKKKA